jgi:high-affinity nickel-transport protein
VSGALRSRVARIRAALTAAEWHRVGLLAAAVLALHGIGFFILLVLVVPRSYSLGAGEALGVGVGIAAYTLGLRHAFDADHIAAIDNTTRKLMSEGQRPLSVGFFFSLGHSTIVVALGVLVGLGVRGLSGSIRSDGSELHQLTGLIGPLVSGSFLLVIGILNLIILANLVGVFRRMRLGEHDEAELERELGSRGFMSRFFGRATKAVRRPWQMYPLGCLFGLGFDTATEIALLALAGTAGAGGLPFIAILCLPILFAAGMTLFDTINGVFVRFAYGWAFSRPIRKVFYNLAITGLSVAVALLIGMIELLAVLGERLSLSGGIWDWTSSLDLNIVGYGIVALFALTWAVALAIWRFGRIEQRWSASEETRIAS